MSTVDKFGRPLCSGKRTATEAGPRGPPGLLPTDKDGHYLVQNKRLKAVHDPEEKQDAVTKQWVERNFPAFSHKQATLPLGSRRLTELALPIQPNDAATKSYVDARILKPSDYEASFKKQVEEMLIALLKRDQRIAHLLSGDNHVIGTNTATERSSSQSKQTKP